MSYDLAAGDLRGLNRAIHALPPTNAGTFEVANVQGQHAVAVGADTDAEIHVRGSVGYYCAGMNKGAT
ncbi:MAG: protein GlxC, partial [Pseudomonadota bacterium]